MASLSNSVQKTKKLVKTFLILIIVIVFLQIFFNYLLPTLMTRTSVTFEVANNRFGVLRDLKIPSILHDTDLLKKISINSENGQLFVRDEFNPNIRYGPAGSKVEKKEISIARVYKNSQRNFANLELDDRIQNLAANIGYSGIYVEDGPIMKFTSQNGFSTLSIDKFTENITIKSDYNKQLGRSTTKDFPNINEPNTRSNFSDNIRSTLLSKSYITEGYNDSSVTIKYLKYRNGDNKYEYSESPSRTTLMRVNLYPKLQLNNIKFPDIFLTSEEIAKLQSEIYTGKIYSQNYTQAPATGLFGSSLSEVYEFSASNYYRNIYNYATYEIYNVLEAWELLKIGKASLVHIQSEKDKFELNEYKPLDILEYKIHNIKLGYYDVLDETGILQPIYIFTGIALLKEIDQISGNNISSDIVFYLPAIKK